MPGLDPLDVAVPTLINDLTAAGGRRVLVLDDYHLVSDRRIHEAVEFLLTYLPRGLRIVVAARFDPPLPIARLRARGQLVEIRQDDLAFTPPEAAGLVTDVADDALDQAHISGLVDRTEGWVAGLHLAALTLRGTPDPAERAEAIRGDDRHVMDYLGQEVLAALPEDQQLFVLRSSVLDRLSGALCDAALERTGSGDLLVALEQAGLFLVALDAQREWYRYHRLFRDAMRRELVHTDADDPRAILERAAGWWQAHGDVEAAVRHLLAAGRQRRAAELLADPGLAIAMASAAAFSGAIVLLAMSAFGGVDTPYGRLSVAICFDADFPWLRPPGRTRRRRHPDRAVQRHRTDRGRRPRRHGGRACDRERRVDPATDPSGHVTGDRSAGSHPRVGRLLRRRRPDDAGDHPDRGPAHAVRAPGRHRAVGVGGRGGRRWTRPRTVSPTPAAAAADGPWVTGSPCAHTATVAQVATVAGKIVGIRPDDDAS